MKSKPNVTVSKPPEETLEPIWEEPALLSYGQEVPGEAQRPAQMETVDLEPKPITLQDVKDYLHAAGKEQQE